MSRLSIPETALVVLIGPSAAGKSTFARAHFRPTEVVSSDVCRGWVADDPEDQAATRDAFALLHTVVGLRLSRRRLTVVDATNVQPEGRRALLALARAHHCLAVALVFDLPLKLLEARNAARTDRVLPAHVIRRHASQLRRSMRGLKREGFRYLRVLRSAEEVDGLVIERTRLWSDKTDISGPFDIIGDVHGCSGELRTLLDRLGYVITGEGDTLALAAPHGRRLVFVGDLVDRGPDAPGCLRLAMAAVRDGLGFCVPGNHEVKLLKQLRGRKVKLTHGLAETVEQLGRESEAFRARVAGFIDGLVSHLIFDEGRLVVAHAGLTEQLQGRTSGRVRSFCLYGETTGETDEFGLPVRYPWADEYRGRALVVYGHTPVPRAEWHNNTICLDTGCVFGGALTALRYPERELVSVPAEREWYAPIRPLAAAPEQRALPELLDLSDITGKQRIETGLMGTLTIREGNAAAALETMSRFAVDPRWLVYLPPTMAPTATCPEGPYLEHPEQAFSWYRGQGVAAVLCEEKHMGSRAVVVLCRDEAAAARRFGIAEQGAGVVLTRTGRPFFVEPSLEATFLERLRSAVTAAGWWARFETDWLVLDAELMPWSAKARGLLQSQYAPVGAAARVGLSAAETALAAAVARTGAGQEELARLQQRRAAVEGYVAAYRGYCWEVEGLGDWTLAPFQLLATEGAVHAEKPHTWHMETLAALCAADPGLLRATRCQRVQLDDADSVAQGVRWWEALTGAGGEGMVIKPAQTLAHGPRGLVQPAVKCRGREYLRIIYGPEYDLPENLERLRARGLGRKRSLALREFALGLEALRLFVAGAPLWQVHRCVFGVLALESEPVDPRL